jgi:hypothetical protein
VLTETDIHYLVGLLSLVSHPDDVEVELGSRVLDTTTGGKRDVDVTVTVKNEERTTAFKGLEVKNHSRKLDATHVEQLACKLKDMPEITESAIVSATGYTRPAIKKAFAHGVSLFELCDWDFSKEQFEHFKSEFCPFVWTSLEWIKTPAVRLNPSQKISEEDQLFIKSNPRVFFGDDETKIDVPDVNQLLKNLQSKVQHNLFERLKDGPKGNDFIKNINANVNISDAPYVKAPSGIIYLREALFTGQMKWFETQRPTHYKVLKKLGEQKPYAGCMVAELGNLGLLGLTVSNTDRNLRFIRVPISDRNKSKIFKQKIR